MTRNLADRTAVESNVQSTDRPIDISKDITSDLSSDVDVLAKTAVVFNRTGHTVWTPALDAALSRLWTQRLTVREIAAKIGITKNAAMGRIHRIKLASRPSPVKPACPAIKNITQDRLDPSASSKADITKNSQEKNGLASRARSMPAPKRANVTGKGRAAVNTANGGASISHDDLRLSHCQWPLSDGRPWLFCGAAAARGPFCQAHASKAFQKSSQPSQPELAPSDRAGSEHDKQKAERAF
jgi:GcrA cell cycle regulator